MNYAYDILLNFLDGCRIYEFFEWQNKDKVVNINKIPIFLVNEKSFSDITNNEVKIDKEFLNEIKNKTTTFNTNKNKYIKYAFIITNKERCYGIETNEEGYIIGRSSLLLDEEEEILTLSDSMKEKDIKYKLENKKTQKKLLTRKLEDKKNFISKELEKAYKNNNKEKLEYIYKEVLKNCKNNNNYDKIISVINRNDYAIINKLYFILKLSSNIYIRKEN